MPELPEVETVAAGLRRFWVGRTIRSVQLNRPNLRFPFPANLAHSLQNRRVEQVERRAKFLQIGLQGGGWLVSHLGMTGAWLFEETGYTTPQKHDHLLLTFTDSSASWYHDPRRFGYIDYFATHEALVRSRHFLHLGVEPLSNHWHSHYLQQHLSRRSMAIKPALMDASLVVGVGNIYASESLHLARIHPDRPANSLGMEELERLVPAVVQVLQAAIASGGSTLRDYTGLKGESGYFQHQFTVYDRAGQPCRQATCQDVIQRSTHAGRSTYFCPSCQPFCA